jgi:hypothetical protein
MGGIDRRTPFMSFAFQAARRRAGQARPRAQSAPPPWTGSAASPATARRAGRPPPTSSRAATPCPRAVAAKGKLSRLHPRPTRNARPAPAAPLARIPTSTTTVHAKVGVALVFVFACLLSLSFSPTRSPSLPPSVAPSPTPRPPLPRRRRPPPFARPLWHHGCWCFYFLHRSDHGVWFRGGRDGRADGIQQPCLRAG